VASLGGAVQKAGGCNVQLGNVFCGRPAVLVIWRGIYGQRRICARHMDDQAIYEDVKEHGWRWEMATPESETPPA